MFKAKLEHKTFISGQRSQTFLKLLSLLLVYQLCLLVELRIGDFQHPKLTFFSVHGHWRADFRLSARAQDPALSRTERILKPTFDGSQFVRANTRKQRRKLLQGFVLGSPLCKPPAVNFKFKR